MSYMDGVAWLDDNDLEYILGHGTFIPRNELELNGYRTEIKYRFILSECRHLIYLDAVNRRAGLGATTTVDIDDYEYRKMQRGHWLLTKRLAEGWQRLVQRVTLYEEHWQRAGEAV